VFLATSHFTFESNSKLFFLAFVCAQGDVWRWGAHEILIKKEKKIKEMCIGKIVFNVQGGGEERGVVGQVLLEFFETRWGAV
jgi:hypothetical protein